VPERRAFDWRTAGAVPRYDPLELDLRTKSFKIAMDHGGRELSASAPIGYGAVSTLQRSRDLGLVPVLGVSDIAETEVILFGPEEWDVIEAQAPAEDVVRRCLALALGDDPVFDTNSLTGQPVRSRTHRRRTEQEAPVRPAHVRAASFHQGSLRARRPE